MPSTNGSTTLPPGVEDLGGGWYRVGDEKVQGRAAAVEAAERPATASGTYREPEPDDAPPPEGTVRMRAVKNVPAKLTGGRRALRGAEFDAPAAHARKLRRGGLAEDA